MESARLHTRSQPASRPFGDPCSQRVLPRFFIIVMAILTLTSIGRASIADDTIRLNFGVYSSNKPSAMVRVFKPMLKVLETRMSERLGTDVDIRMQIARDYDRGITDLTEGRVDFSRFGPASYIEAKNANGQLDILAVENERNSRVFYGIIAVAADSEIQHIDQLHGRSFAFGDEGSTIGRFLSQLYLERHGIRAGNLSRYEYLGRHDKVGTAVGAGDFDAGALNERTFKKLVDAGENIRELARFPNVTKPWIARSNLDPVVFEALQASLLEINDTEALAALKIDGFLTGSDADYNDIRRAIENNAVFFAEPTAFSAASPVNAGDNRSVPGLQAAIGEIGSSEFIRHGKQITVNITLPSNLFDVEDGAAVDTPSRVTINLTIPGTTGTTTINGTAVQDKHSDGGDR